VPRADGRDAHERQVGRVHEEDADRLRVRARRRAPLSRPQLRPEAPVALERAVAFLLARQGADGLWRDFDTPAGEASEWPTGFVGAALALAGTAADRSALDRAADALLAAQNSDGGWGYHEGVPTDADSTACVLLFLALLGRDGTATRRAASCLVSHQRSDGGVATYREPGPIRRFMGVGRWMRFGGWCGAQLEVTATVGRALGAAALDGRSAGARAAWRYVRTRQRADGSWGSYWWTTPHYATQQAVELATALGDREPLVRAAGWARSGTPADAGAFATALTLSILVDAGADTDRAVERLLALQAEDGGWPSAPIMRIPYPGDTDPDRPRGRGFRGLLVADQHRTFTTAACVAALARARATIH
jgi:squalene-hopene/tetraprenyl-beta-curcumene cyclase